MENTSEEAFALWLGALSAFSFQGVLIDSAGKRYLKYDRFLKLKIGRWTSSSNSLLCDHRANQSEQQAHRSLTHGSCRRIKKGPGPLRLTWWWREMNATSAICRGSLETMTEEATPPGQASADSESWIIPLMKKSGSCNMSLLLHFNH